MPESAKVEDEDVLTGAAGVQQSNTALRPPLPFPKPEVIELPQFFRNDEGRDPVFQALFKQYEPSDTSVAVLKRVDLLEARMEVDDIFERLVDVPVPSKQFRHLAMNVFDRARLQSADRILQPLVISDREPPASAVARAALELRVQHFDVALGQSGARRFYHQIDTAEVVGGLHDVVDGQIAGQVAYRSGLEYPARLLARQAAAFHVVGIVCEFDLEPMVKPARDVSALFSFQNVKNARRQSLCARFAPRTFGVRGYPPCLAEHINSGDIPLFAVELDAARSKPPLLCGFGNGNVLHVWLS